MEQETPRRQSVSFDSEWPLTSLCQVGFFFCCVSRTRIQGCCDTPRGESKQEYMTLIVFFYSYHRPSTITNCSTNELILIGPLGITWAHESLHGRLPYNSTRHTVIRPWTLRRERTVPRPVIHAQARSYVDLLRVLFHPCAHSSTVSPLGRVKSRQEPFIPIDPV